MRSMSAVEKTSPAGSTAAESLSDRDREILALRHFKELSYKEIATALAIPEGTVMSRLFRARRVLEAELASFASRDYGIDRAA